LHDLALFWSSFVFLAGRHPLAARMAKE